MITNTIGNDVLVVGNLKKAAEAVGTYLLFKPNDDEMLKNQQFYLEQAEVTEEDIKPRMVCLYNSSNVEVSSILLTIAQAMSWHRICDSVPHIRNV